MFIIITTMVCGIIAGKVLRHRISSVLPRITTVLIWGLLFLLGAEAGSNESIVKEFVHMGTEAFIITLGALAGSILSAWMLWRWINGTSDKIGE